MTRRATSRGFVPAGQQELILFIAFVAFMVALSLPALRPDASETLGCTEALAAMGRLGGTDGRTCPEEGVPYRWEATGEGGTITCAKPEGHLLHGLRVQRGAYGWRFAMDLPPVPEALDATVSAGIRETRIVVTEEEAVASTTRRGWFRKSAGTLMLLVSGAVILACLVATAVGIVKKDWDKILLVVVAGVFVLPVLAGLEWAGGGRRLRVEAGTGKVTVFKTWFGEPSGEGTPVETPLAVLAAPISDASADLVLAFEDGDGELRFCVLGVVSPAAGEALAALNRGLPAGPGPKETVPSDQGSPSR